jgi:hypothetical protein
MGRSLRVTMSVIRLRGSSKNLSPVANMAECIRACDIAIAFVNFSTISFISFLFHTTSLHDHINIILTFCVFQITKNKMSDGGDVYHMKHLLCSPKLRRLL